MIFALKKRRHIDTLVALRSCLAPTDRQKSPPIWSENTLFQDLKLHPLHNYNIFTRTASYSHCHKVTQSAPSSVQNTRPFFASNVSEAHCWTNSLAFTSKVSNPKRTSTCIVHRATLPKLWDSESIVVTCCNSCRSVLSTFRKTPASPRHRQIWPSSAQCCHLPDWDEGKSLETIASPKWRQILAWLAKLANDAHEAKDSETICSRIFFKIRKTGSNQFKKASLIPLQDQPLEW